MTNIYIKNGRVITGSRILDGATVTINNGKIVAIGLPSKKRLLRPSTKAQDEVPSGAEGLRRPAFGGAPRNDVIIDAKGCFVSPGFIDCHIHGEPEKIFLSEAKYGTTAFVIAESCAPLNHIYKRAEGIKEFIGMHPFGPNLLGLRLEGPYISKEKAGAQSPSCIRKPDAKELSEIIKKIEPVPILKIMTIAPELEGARPLINILRKNGIIASIGHSAASYEKAIEGIDSGVTHATHTFNAMSGIDPSTSLRVDGERSRTIDRREPGVVGAVLMDDRVTAEIILDLVHVHKALFGLLMKAKGKEKIIIITDSISSEIASARFAGLAMTRKMEPVPILKPVPIFTGGAYRFQNGRLAGSSLTMIGALKNAVTDCNVPLSDAIRFITLNPARLLGVEKSKGSIAPGKDADIVVFDKEFNVKATIIRGRIAYKARR